MLNSMNAWVIFNGFLILLIFFDFVVFSRKEKEIGLKSAGVLTVFWTIIAGIVGVFIFLLGNNQLGIEYVTSYVAERALSIDNLFVFLIIFNYFAIPNTLKQRALLFGIMGALIARAIFIALGVALISTFSWFLIVLGLFLIYTAYKLAFKHDTEVDPSKNVVAKLFSKFIVVTKKFDGHKLFTRLPSGALAATPFLLVVIVLGSTDVVFAIDSIPTVFGITDNAFIVWSSNAMAVLGMRPLYFLIAGLVDIFRFLQYGLAAILGFIGVKMVVEQLFHGAHIISEQADIFLALAIIVGVLTTSILASIFFPAGKQNIEKN